MTPVPDRTEQTQEQPGRRDPRLGEPRTPPEQTIDTRRLAETLSEDDLARALERGLAKAGAQWNLSL